MEFNRPPRNQLLAQQKPIRLANRQEAPLTEADVKREVKHFLDSTLTDFYKKNPPSPAKIVYEFSPVQIEKIAITGKTTGKVAYFYVVDTSGIAYDETGGRHAQLAKVPSDDHILFFSSKPTGEWEYGEAKRDEVNRSIAALPAIQVERSLLPSGQSKQDSYKAEQPPIKNAQPTADHGKLYLLQQTSVGPYGFSVSYCWYAFGQGDLAYRCAAESDTNGFFAASALDTFDVAGACQASPKSCGKLSGGSIKWTDGSETKVEQRSDGLHISGLKVLSLRPFARGQRFDGQFEMMGGVYSSVAYKNGSANMYFNMDGTFHDASGKGTYEVLGATLILNYQGRQVKLPVMDFGVNREKTPQGMPEALFIGDRYYKRHENGR